MKIGNKIVTVMNKAIPSTAQYCGKLAWTKLGLVRRTNELRAKQRIEKKQGWVDKIKINYGCGNQKLNGYTGVDIRKTKATDIVIDDKAPLPFKDNSIDKIFCDNVLEHVEDLFFVITEFHRICKPGATIEILVPHFSRSQFEYHRRTCRYNFLQCHCLERGDNDSYPVYFKAIKRKLIMPKRWKGTFIDHFINKYPRKYENTPLRSLIFVSQVYVLLEVIKEPSNA